MTRWRSLPPGIHTTLQAGACLFCLATSIWDPHDIGASEFRGGWLTGRLFGWNEQGILILLAVLPFTFLYRRAAAVAATVGALLGLPMYLYLVAPGAFRWLVPGEWSVPLRSAFYWDTWALSCILAIVVGMGVFVASAKAASSPPRMSRLLRRTGIAAALLFTAALVVGEVVAYYHNYCWDHPSSKRCRGFGHDLKVAPTTRR